MTRRGGARRFRIRILPSVLLTAAILLLPAMLYAWGRQDDSFAVERIKVTGTKRIGEKDALKLLRAQYLGANLFTVTRGDVRETLDKLPYLSRVVIDREFPTTLRVRVVEHRPAAYVLGRDTWYVVSDRGHVIKALGTKEADLAADPAPSGEDGAQTGEGAEVSATEETADIDASRSSPSPSAEAGEEQAAPPVDDPATGASLDPSAVAEALDRGPAGVELRLPRIGCDHKLKPGRSLRDQDVGVALTVLAGLPGSLRARVDVVDVQPGRQVTLALQGGLEVEYGDTQRLVAKALALRAVLRAYEQRGKDASFVDVSIPDRPLGRPRLTS